MKNLIFILLITITFFSCNNNTKSTKISENLELLAEENATTAEKIANANGYENWKDVSEIAFTFNVNRNDNHFERSWIWKPKTNDVSMISATDTTNYNRSKVDSLNMNIDASFINDKYWLLAPFQIVWDEGTSFSEKENVIAPISKDTLNQLTIVYKNDGGYTPGDAYDFFYDKNFKIREWNYRKGNAAEPSMTTTWEDYENFNGLEISKTHKDTTSTFKLYFTNISVKK